VSAKTIKNKVAAPFRTVNFEIHFGKGIREHEQVFDVLRKHGQETIDGKTVCVSGTSAWKSLIVADAATGKNILEKKFYKPDFDKILTDPQCSPYLEDLLKKAMIRKMEDSSEANIDSESYEEIRAVSMELESGLLDPEG
jgi:hypothetical protein